MSFAFGVLLYILGTIAVGICILAIPGPGGAAPGGGAPHGHGGH